MAEEILIDFKVDYTELINAQEQLAQGGKIDASGFASVKKAITSTATDTKGLIAEFKKVSTTATQLGKSVEAAFGAGVQDALDEAGVSLKDFSTALTKANAPAKTLKAELRELKESLAAMKVAGKDTGVEFDALRARAGKLEDAIRDAGAEIRNAGSDTRGIDNVVGSISALAGGFAAVQGAAALFGDENEDLQKALLKVNGAMSLAIGLQQIAAATTKEGALTKLADSVATGVQTATQRIYTAVTGQATAATVAFKIALASTGIGLIVIAVVALVMAMKDYGEKTDQAVKVTDKLKESIADLNSDLEQIRSNISANGRLQLELIRQRGGSEKELSDKTIEFLKLERDEITKTNEKRKENINDALEASGIFGKGLIRNKKDADDLVKSLTKISAALPEGNKQKESIDAAISATEELAASIKEVNELNDEIIIKGEEFKTKAILASIKKREEDAEKNAAKEKLRIAALLADQLAALERQLLAVEKNSQAEINIQKDIVRKKADIELNGAKLTKNQIELINERATADQLKLQDAFNKKATAEQLQSQIDTNAAILAGVGINNEERLRLQIENIGTTSQLEINAAEGNAAKILLIEAKKLADIRAFKLAAIDKERADQIAASQKNNDIIMAALEKIAADIKLNDNVRIAAIKGIERQELLANQNLIDDNERKHEIMAISDEEYYKKRKELIEKTAEIERKAEEASVKVVKEAAKTKLEAFVEENEKLINNIIQTAAALAEFYGNLADLATEQERQRIEAQKKQLQSLVDAGAITEKQAKIRAQQIEIAERQAKQRQAQREKQAATFKALLAIPEAFLNGLATGGIYLAAIYAALAAAQAALIISRPVPKFFRGKKDSYEGRASVAEIGSELVERNGRMFLYTKPTETYLHARDKVYTAAETRQIMHNTNINTTAAPAAQERIDYKKLADAIPKSSFSVNIDKDFIEESVNKGLSKNRYFNNRYTFKR